MRITKSQLIRHHTCHPRWRLGSILQCTECLCNSQTFNLRSCNIRTRSADSTLSHVPRMRRTPNHVLPFLNAARGCARKPLGRSSTPFWKQHRAEKPNCTSSSSLVKLRILSIVGILQARPRKMKKEKRHRQCRFNQRSLPVNAHV